MATEDPASINPDMLTPEEKVHRIETRVRQVFPIYTITDKTLFDGYNPVDDPDNRGQILTLLTEGGKEQGAPQMMFIFKEGGFTLNYYNHPTPAVTKPIQNLNNSLFAPFEYIETDGKKVKTERRWTVDELDFALEKAQIHIAGIDPNDEELRNQLAGYSPATQAFETMEERMQAFQEFRKRQPRRRVLHAPEVRLASVWDLLYNGLEEHAYELAIARIQQRNTYTYFSGTEYPTEEIVRHLRKNTRTPRGNYIMRRELHIIEANEALLKQKRLL